MEENSPKTSEALIQSAMLRDAEGWTRFVQLYSPLVRHWCVEAGMKGDDMDDVCQDIFVGTLLAIRKYRYDSSTGSFRRWLWGVSQNRIRRFFSKKSQRYDAIGGSDARGMFEIQRDPLAEDLNAVEPNHDSSDVVQELYFRALELVRNDFEPATWQAFWETTVEGKKATDVAAALGMSSAAVRKAKSRVLHRVR